MRTKIIWAVLAVAVALIAWVLMAAPSAPGRVGVNRLVENTVTTTAAGQADWRPSVTGADVNFGDRVATAAASRLEISLLDRSMLTVGANARLDIDRFVYDPERDIVGVAVSVLRGAFRFASDNRGVQPEPIAFRTPGAAIGIRGTMIEGVVGPEAVALLAGIPGAPDLSVEADSAAVIILREGAIGIAVNGQSLVLDRPVQMVALTRTRLYPPFGVSDAVSRRFERLLPTRADTAVPSPAPPAVEPVAEVPPPVIPREPPRAADPGVIALPPARDPRAGAPPVRPAPTRQTAPVEAAPPIISTTRAPPRAADPAPVAPPAPAETVEAAAPRPQAREPSALESLARSLLARRPASTPTTAPEPSTATAVPTGTATSEPRARAPVESQPQSSPTAAPRPQ